MDGDGVAAALPGFDAPPVAPERGQAESSYRSRRVRVRRARSLIEQGRHPANGLPLRTLTGPERCGDCRFAARKEWGRKTFIKCIQGWARVSGSEATDIRASWPACVKWERGPSVAGGSDV